MESHDDDFSRRRQSVKICKISAKSPHHEEPSIFPIKNIFKFDSVILLTLSRFSMLSRVKVLGKLKFYSKLST